MGDAAGIGSEITARMLAYSDILEYCIPIVIADARVVQQGYGIIGEHPAFEVIDTPGRALDAGKAYVYDLENLAPTDYTLGEIAAAAGRAAGESIERAVQMALAEEIDAIVTNPIHKEAFNLGGYGKRYPGHTEMLAALTDTARYCMMLVSGRMRVCHVTTHVSLLDALTQYITTTRILEVIKLAHEMGQRLGIAHPKIGVPGINPHAGEHGLFGDEEQRIIIPAIEAAVKLGIQAEGPIPPDSLYPKAKGGWYDVVLAMYHDQGHIPCKVEGFIYDDESDTWTMSGVNVTLGLPIIRTSVDHGTAFDRAGEGTANARSLIEATHFAIQLAGGRA
jgi:4-hydroxythreonine-4-phosphate dehydrogenase